MRLCWYPHSLLLLHHISWLFRLKVDGAPDWNTLLPRIQVVLVPAGSEHIHDSRICKQKGSQDVVLHVCLKYIFWSVYTSVWSQRKSYHLQLCLSLGALRAVGQSSQQTSASFINCKRGKQHSMFVWAQEHAQAVSASLKRNDKRKKPQRMSSIKSTSAPF